MKHNKAYTLIWSAVLAFLLGLGSVGSLATGLDLPVNIKALVFWCAALSLALTGVSLLDKGLWAGLGMGCILFLSPDFWTQVKTLGAAIAWRLRMGYGIPTPGFLQGEQSESVLAVLCLLSSLIMLFTAYTVERQKSCVLPVALSLVPLAGCITVIDTVPDSPWLFLWGLGLVLLLLTQGVRKRSHRQANRLSALLALPTAGALVLLFLLIPRDAQWSLPVPDPFSNPSPSITVSPPEEQVDLTDLGPRTPTNVPVMEVTAEFSGPLYLRCRDYDEYTGTGWLATQNRNEILYGYSPTWHLDHGRVEITALKPQSYYAIPAYTVQAQSVTGGMVENSDGQTHYGFDWCILQPDWTLLGSHSSVPTVNPRYLDLPAQTFGQAAAYFENNGWHTGDLLQRAEQVRQAVSNTAPYDLFTPNMPQEETDLAMWFLQEAPSGYCVHYATAAAVLLRSSGIPARYVEGYLVQAEAGKTVTVRDLHAHAWVEYYVNDVGWVVLEATPSDGQVSDPTDPTQATEATESPSTDPTEVTEQEPTATTPTDPTGEQKPVSRPQPATWVGKALVWVSGLCLAFAVLLGQYYLRRLLLKHALRRGNHNRCALAIYRQTKRLYRFLKQPIPPELTGLTQKARFSHHSLTAQELKQMRRQLRSAQQEAQKAPLHRRLWAKWILALY